MAGGFAAAAAAAFGYWAAIAACVGLLAGIRALLGVGLFSALVWVWFIAHFVKAELVFVGNLPGLATGSGAFSPPSAGWSVSWQPVVAFAWLSLVLFNVAKIEDRPWMLFSGCSVLGAVFLVLGGWRTLATGASFLPVLALFFDGEAYVWGAYGRYMHPAFRVGVYVFHVAGASFFHYLGSYAFGNARASRDRWLRPASILAVNLAVVALCCAVAWLPALGWLTPLLGLGWFTLWVAAHLAASDLLPLWKRLAKQATPAAVAMR